MTNVDYVCVVDAIGNPDKIATGAAKPTTDVRKIMMADYCTQFVINTPLLQGRLFVSDGCRRGLHRLYDFASAKSWKSAVSRWVWTWRYHNSDV